MGFASMFGGGDVDLSGAKDVINQGKTQAIGASGMPGDNGYLQAWNKEAINGFVKPGLDATSWANDASKTWLGGNGADARTTALNGFMDSGPLQAALGQASKAQQAASSGQGLSNSGAATQALANTQARMGYQATQDHTANLFKQQQMAGQYANMGNSNMMHTGDQIANVGISAANAQAGIIQNEQMAKQASNAAGWSNMFNLAGAAMKAFGGGGGGGAPAMV
jgi:hypothetical protein